jgi:hypothetical protein
MRLAENSKALFSYGIYTENSKLYLQSLALIIRLRRNGKTFRIISKGGEANGFGYH